jgi:hypothetical protein
MRCEMTRFFTRILMSFSLLAQVGFAAQAPASHFDPGRPSGGQQKSFFDFLVQSKSQKSDLGKCIEDVRRIGIESTIDNFNYWSNIVALVAALGLFLYILKLRCRHKQTLVSTAQALTKLQNQLATGHQNYQQLYKAYSQYLQEFDREKEPKLPLKSAVSRGRNAGDQRDIVGDLKAAPAAVVVAPLDQTQALNQPAVSNDTFSSLRQQITTLTQQVEQERQKNRKLRGE